MADSFQIGITSKVKNGYLLKAIQKIGSGAALARYLGIHNSCLNSWLNLRVIPRWWDPRDNSSVNWPEVEKRLLALIGHTLDEIFPRELEHSSLISNTKEHTVITEVPISEILINGYDQFYLPPSQEDVLLQRESIDLIQSSMSHLTLKQQKVLHLRFGLNGNYEHTLEEVGEKLGLSKERVRQIESKALRSLRKPLIDDKNTILYNPNDLKQLM